jgi:late competence protein required for DNA uptake (superfamily II DNA/RNA helicase)
LISSIQLKFFHWIIANFNVKLLLNSKLSTHFENEINKLFLFLQQEIISRLRDGRLNLVVTTELAARGLDIPDLTHVINFELPTDAQHYVHRAGRCGRAGRKGLVMNFANPDTKFVIRRFGKQLGVKVQDCEIRDGQVCLKAK